MKILLSFEEYLTLVIGVLWMSAEDVARSQRLSFNPEGPEPNSVKSDFGMTDTVCLRA